MCLSKVLTRHDGKSKTIHTGYKVFFGGVSTPLKFPFYGLEGSYDNREVQTGRWLQAKQATVRVRFSSGPAFDYTSGFHIFKTEEDAKRWKDHMIVVKVRYRGVLATGFQNNIQCVVANEMYVSKRDLPKILKDKK